jgi:isopropylmalate/homocitrate/citramalate synthase
MSLWQNCHDKRFLQVSTATKIELVEGLVAAGLQQVEVTSFVSPVWVPQLADAAELCASIFRKKGVKYPVLVPNLKASTERFCCTQGRLSLVFVTLLILYLMCCV